MAAFGLTFSPHMQNVVFELASEMSAGLYL